MGRIAASVAAATAMVAMATPAAASLWLVNGSGQMFQTLTPPGENRLEGVPFEGLSATFSLLIDDSVVPFANFPPGGIGQSRTYPGAVVGFALTVGGYTITRTAEAPASLFILNDAGASPTVRVDQIGYSENFRFQGGITPYFQTDAPLPAGGFVSAFNFGRLATTVAPAVPDLLTSADFPPLDSVWQPGPAQILTLEVRAGTATTIPQLVQLPRARFALQNLQFEVQRVTDAGVVPEPASWALMIAGFGAVGVAARRRRAVA